MKLKLWGTRGSLPRAIGNQQFIEIFDNLARKAEKSGLQSISELRNAVRDGDLGNPIVFGGNTSCYEVIYKSHRLYVDMGTGLMDAMKEAMKNGQTEFTFFQTHLHWDHIMGLPFFVPLYLKGHKITIYHVHPRAPEYIKYQFNGVNFPVKWEEISATVEFKKIKPYQEVKFDNLTVTPFALDHPGGCFGYRFDGNGLSAAIGVDGEYKRLSKKDLGKDLVFYQNLDILVFDAQYDLDELASRFDWGHCTPQIGVELALREGIRNLILAHHDPNTSEEKGFQMKLEAEKFLTSQLSKYSKKWKEMDQAQGPIIRSAYDGAEFDLAQLKEEVIKNQPKSEKLDPAV